MNKKDPLLPLIEDAQRRQAKGQELIEQGRQLAEAASIELKAYERANAVLNGTNDKKASDQIVSHKKWPSHGSAPESKVSDKWRSIYKHLHEQVKSPYSYDDVILVMEVLGYRNPKKVSVRSHMGGAVQSGLFTKPADGRFAFTEKARRIFGLPNNNTGATDDENVAPNTFRRDLLSSSSVSP